MNNGGPAFPHQRPLTPSEAEIYRNRAGCASAIGVPDGYEPGLTLRDYFAAQALIGFCYHELIDRGAAGVAKVVYEVADAMLKERAK